jgi:hypothetical protein
VELTRWLHDAVRRRAERTSVHAAAAEMEAVVAQLRERFEIERQALVDPSGSAPLVAELERAKERAAGLRGESARWQQALADGITDLTADADHDLRSRSRDVVREAEDALDGGDPQDLWEEFAPWLEHRMAADVARSYVLLARRSEELGAVIADQFTIDEAALADLPRPAPAQFDDVAVRELTTRRPNIGTQTMTVLRGSYGGLAMFGLMGSLVGLSLVSPFGLAAGVLMGRKSLRDERDRQLTIRRQQAKQAVRTYVDDVIFQVGKDFRDAMRQVQRFLRDTFAARADEASRSAADALAAAQRAMQQQHADRQRRSADVAAELDRLAGLRDAVLALSAASAP